MIKQFLTKLSVMVVLMGAVCNLYAASSADPVSLLQRTTDQLLSQLKTERDNLKRDPQLVYKIVNQILMPHVDTEAMSRSVINNVVWEKLTAKQRRDFIREFTTLVIHTYASALSAYKDEQVRYYPLREDIGTQQRLQVKSVIIQDGGQRVSVNYWLIRHGATWMVYDMSVEGVSLLESFRSQFASELSQGNFDSLYNNLVQHNQATK